MPILLLSLFLSFAITTSSLAADRVMDAYRNYQSAIDEGKERKALRAARNAYEFAEEDWGAARKETALLATNYANLLMELEHWRRAEDIYRRCITILAVHEDALKETIDCELGVAFALRRQGNSSEAEAANNAILAKLAPMLADEQWAQIAAGDAYLELASLSKREGRHVAPRGNIGSGRTGTRIDDREGELVAVAPNQRANAEKAIAFYRSAFTQPDWRLAQAYRIAGNLAEKDGDFEIAEAHYRSAYELLLIVSGEEAPETIRMDGMAAFMKLNRISLKYKEENYAAREPSGPDCIVYIRDNVEVEACRELRIPPYFPNQALYKDQQGFVLLKYDITEDGIVENLNIIHSWPGGIFDQRALQAAQKWKYYPPKDQYGNSVSLTDVHTQIRFIIDG